MTFTSILAIDTNIWALLGSQDTDSYINIIINKLK